MAVSTTPDGEARAYSQQAPAAVPQPGPARDGKGHFPQQPGVAVITLPREIDISNDRHVQDILTRALAGGTAVLIVDASATTFCDCAGVRALVLAQDRAAAAGAQLRLVVVGAVMQRVLDLTGTGLLFDSYPTLAAAVAGPPELLAMPPCAGSDACLWRGQRRRRLVWRPARGKRLLTEPESPGIN